MGRKCNTLLIGGTSSSSESFRNTNTCPRSHHTYSGRRIGHFQLHRPQPLQSGFLPGHHGRFSTLVSIGEDDNKSCGTIHRVMPVTTTPISKISTKNHIITTPIYQKHGHGNGSGTMGNSSRNQNVAIATQVLSPSAIGNSLTQHKRRLVKPFREQNEDEDGDDIFNRRKSINWNRIGSCGVSIVVTVAVFTGVLLAVGYLQAEKHKISTRPSKLAQNDNETLESKSSEIEPSIIIPIIPNENFHYEDNNSLENDSSSEESLNSTLHEVEKTPVRDKEIAEVDDDNRILDDNVSELDKRDGNSTNDDDSGLKSAINVVNNNGLDEEDARNENESVLKEVTDPKQHETSNNNTNQTFLDQLPSEVKVLPPKDFNFKGFSFQIPIYNVSNPNVIDGLMVSLTPPQKSLISNQDFDLNTAYSNLAKATEISNDNATNTEEELPTVAKLQTDLFDEDDTAEYPEEKTHKPTFYRQNNSYKGPPRVEQIDPGYTPRPGTKVQPIENQKTQNQAESHRPKPIIKFVKLRGPNRNLPIPPASSPTPPENFHEYHQNLQKENYDVSTPFPELPSTPTSNYPNIQTNLHSESESQTPYPSSTTTSTTQIPFQFDFTQLTTSNPSSNTDLFQNSVNNFDLSDFGLEKGSTSTNAFSLPNFSFTHFDSPPQPSPTTPSYSFGNNLLSSPSITTVMGLPSSLGANLNLYNPSPNANSNEFDFGNGGQNYGTNIPTGVVPIDLASSYIPVSIQSNYGSKSNDYESFSNQNFNHQPQFNFGGNSQNPNTPYNTITGGIQLLSLLSGNIPKHLISNGGNQGNDQFSSGSTYYSSNSFSTPSTQTFDINSFIDKDVNPYMTAYNIPAVSTFNPFLQAQGRSFNTDTEAEGSSIFQHASDQDQMGSFSQTIISKLKNFNAIPYPNSISNAPVASALQQQENMSSNDDRDPNTNQVLDILGIKDIIEQYSNQRNSRSDESSAKPLKSGKEDKKKIDKKSSLPEMLDKAKPPVKKDGASILGNSNTTTDLETAASELLNSELLRIAQLNNTQGDTEKVNSKTKLYNNKNKKLEFKRGLQSGFYG